MPKHQMNESDYQAVKAHLHALAIAQETQQPSSPAVADAYEFARSLKAQHFPKPSTKVRIGQLLVFLSVSAALTKGTLLSIESLRERERLFEYFGLGDSKLFDEMDRLHWELFALQIFGLARLIFSLPSGLKIAYSMLVDLNATFLNCKKTPDYPNSISILPIKGLKDNGASIEQLWEIYKYTFNTAPGLAKLIEELDVKFTTNRLIPSDNPIFQNWSKALASLNELTQGKASRVLQAPLTAEIASCLSIAAAVYTFAHWEKPSFSITTLLFASKVHAETDGDPISNGFFTFLYFIAISRYLNQEESLLNHCQFYILSLVISYLANTAVRAISHQLECQEKLQRFKTDYPRTTDFLNSSFRIVGYYFISALSTSIFSYLQNLNISAQKEFTKMEPERPDPQEEVNYPGEIKAVKLSSNEEAALLACSNHGGSCESIVRRVVGYASSNLEFKERFRTLSG